MIPNCPGDHKGIGRFRENREEDLMDDKTMTNEENYRFDVAGYMIVPSVLTAAELNACNQALDQLASNNGPLRWTSPVCNPLRALREHPVLMQYLEQICGEGVRLDESPRLVESCTEATDLSGGDEWVDWSRAYRQYNGHRFCQGVRAFWGAGGRECRRRRFDRSTCQPQQHGAGPARPSGRNRSYGTRRTAGLASGRSPALHRIADAGGYAALAGRGGRNACSNAGYISTGVRPGAASEIHGDDSALPEWADDLTEIERAVLHNPNRPVPAARGAFGRQKGLAGRGARDFPSLDLHPRPRFRD